MQNALSIFKPAVWIILIIVLLTCCQQLEQQPVTKQESTPEVNTVDKQPTESGSDPGLSENEPKEAKGSTFTATVVKVVDGDTVKIKVTNGQEETVRLLLIDTPETVHPSKPVQPYGKEASQFAKKLMPAGSQIEVEPGISERDKYGRLLAYFYVNGESVNKKLLENGLARVAYVYPPNTKYIDEFTELQDQARQKELGIWSIENYATAQGFDDSNATTAAETDETADESSSCDIKGNINSSGEKIYHVPSGQYYGITKPEEMFCTEAAAEKAGFRKSQR